MDLPSTVQNATAVATLTWPPIAIAALYLAAHRMLASYAKRCGATNPDRPLDTARPPPYDGS
jgi:hypothetical protein